MYRIRLELESSDFGEWSERSYQPSQLERVGDLGLEAHSIRESRLDAAIAFGGIEG
jgi:hypothetical protein